jgi:hypothetical protein
VQCVPHQTMAADGTASFKKPGMPRNASRENPVHVSLQDGEHVGADLVRRTRARSGGGGGEAARPAAGVGGGGRRGEGGGAARPAAGVGTRCGGGGEAAPRWWGAGEAARKAAGGGGEDERVGEARMDG